MNTPRHPRNAVDLLRYFIDAAFVRERQQKPAPPCTSSPTEPQS
jgi:hypothetical protein